MSKCTISNITASDINAISALMNCDLSKQQNDICYEKSLKCLDEQQNIVALIITKEHSIQDFFGGKIPEEFPTCEIPEYVTFDKNYVANVIERGNQKHYEILYVYYTKLTKIMKLYTLINADVVHNLIWCQKSNPCITEEFLRYCNLFNYNNVIEIDTFTIWAD